MLSIAICDDEKSEIEKIRTLLELKLEAHAIIYEIKAYESGEDLLADNKLFDIAFLDISMKEISGVEVGIKLYQRSQRIKIVYITSFNEYWEEAINQAHAFAYLSKPINKEKLLKQVHDLVNQIGTDKENIVEIELRNVKELGSNEKEYKSIRVPVPDILYYEYVKATRKIKVKTVHCSFEYSGTIAEVEKRMGVYGFGTCYRGILVNLEHVMRAKGDTVYLNTGEMLPLSQKRVAEFKNQLSDYIYRSI